MFMQDLHMNVFLNLFEQFLVLCIFFLFYSFFPAQQTRIQTTYPTRIDSMERNSEAMVKSVVEAQL